MFYFQNWQQAFHLIPILQLTDHTWSLAIEEQFYLVWPTLLLAHALLLARRAGRDPLSAALIVALTLAAASAIEKIVLWSGAGSQARIYYGTDTRADSLLIGAALGICYVSGRARPAPPLPAGARARRAAGHRHHVRLRPRQLAAALPGWPDRLRPRVRRAHRRAGARTRQPARARARRSSAGLARPHLLRHLPLALAGLPLPAPGPARLVVGADPVRADRSDARRGDDLFLRASSARCCGCGTGSIPRSQPRRDVAADVTAPPPAAADAGVAG